MPSLTQQYPDLMVIDDIEEPPSESLTDLMRYCMNDFASDFMLRPIIRDPGGSITRRISHRIPEGAFYGRSYVEEITRDVERLTAHQIIERAPSLRDMSLLMYGARPRHRINDEYDFTITLKEPAMTEVTAVEPVVSLDPKERPALPEGVTYMFDDADHITITDVSGAPESFLSDDYRNLAYLYQARPGASTDCGDSYFHLAESLRGRPSERIHFVRHPANASYSRSPSYSDNPARFAFYHYDSSNPWKDLGFWKENILRWAEHMPAPSAKHPGLLMYFQSPEKRARDIRTPIKPGKYLKKYFSDLLTGEEINDLAVKWANMATPPKLNLAFTADDIERLYRGRYNGSCMHFKDGGYDGDEHPARAYEGPDLAQAYIGDIDNADGRCLVWPEKKKYYPKWYGDYRRLEAALIEAGYTAGHEYEFFDARISKIPYGSRFIAPYLDVGGHVYVDGEYLRICDDDHEGAIYCRNTEGYTNASGPRCAYSGDVCDEDDMTYVEGYGDVGPSALNNYFSQCYLSDEYYHNDAVVETENGYTVSNAALENPAFDDQWFRCDYSDDLYIITYQERHKPIEMANGETWSHHSFVRNGVVCDLSGDRYATCDVTFLDNGKVVADEHIDLDDVDYRAFAGLEANDNETITPNVEAEAA